LIKKRKIHPNEDLQMLILTIVAIAFLFAMVSAIDYYFKIMFFVIFSVLQISYSYLAYKNWVKERQSENKVSFDKQKQYANKQLET
jgi:membrane protein implicated in regulation of membrane protease activity